MSGGRNVVQIQPAKLIDGLAVGMVVLCVRPRTYHHWADPCGTCDLWPDRRDAYRDDAAAKRFCQKMPRLKVKTHA